MKKYLAPLLVQFVMLCCLAACTTGDRGTVAPTPQPAPTRATMETSKPSEDWQIELSMSGGFAGVRRSATLSSNGQMIAKDLKINKQVTVQIPEKDLTQISGLVRQAQPAPPTDQLSNCRDCFHYEFTLKRGKQQFSVQADDTTLESSGMGPLINQLADLQEKALAGKLNP